MAIPDAAHPRVARPWFWTGIVYGFLVGPWLGPGVLPVIGISLLVGGMVLEGLLFVGLTMVVAGAYIGWLAWYTRALAGSFKYELTKDTLTIQRGVWWRKTSRIPLRRVQDVVSKEGPFLRAAGLGSVHVQTAGLSAANGSLAVEGLLVGLEDARGVAEEILSRVKKLKGDV